MTNQIFITISGPQGACKTTIAQALVELLEAAGVNVCAGNEDHTNIGVEASIGRLRANSEGQDLAVLILTETT